MNKKNLMFIITFIFIILSIMLTGEVKAEDTKIKVRVIYETENGESISQNKEYKGNDITGNKSFEFNANVDNYFGYKLHFRWAEKKENGIYDYEDFKIKDLKHAGFSSVPVGEIREVPVYDESEILLLDFQFEEIGKNLYIIYNIKEGQYCCFFDNKSNFEEAYWLLNIDKFKGNRCEIELDDKNKMITVKIKLEGIGYKEFFYLCNENGASKTGEEIMFVPYLLKETKKNGELVLEKATKKQSVYFLDQEKLIYPYPELIEESDSWCKAKTGYRGRVPVAYDLSEVEKNLEYFALFQDVSTGEYFAYGFSIDDPDESNAWAETWQYYSVKKSEKTDKFVIDREGDVESIIIKIGDGIIVAGKLPEEPTEEETKTEPETNIDIELIVGEYREASKLIRGVYNLVDDMEIQYTPYVLQATEDKLDIPLEILVQGGEKVDEYTYKITEESKLTISEKNVSIKEPIYILVKNVKTEEHIAVKLEKEGNKYVYKEIKKVEYDYTNNVTRLVEGKADNVIIETIDGETYLRFIEDNSIKIEISDLIKKILGLFKFKFSPRLLAEEDGELIETDVIVSAEDETGTDDGYKETDEMELTVSDAIREDRIYYLLFLIGKQSFVAKIDITIDINLNITFGDVYKAKYEYEEWKKDGEEIIQDAGTQPKPVIKSTGLEILRLNYDEKPQSNLELVYVPYLVKGVEKDGQIILEETNDITEVTAGIYDDTTYIDENGYSKKAITGENGKIYLDIDTSKTTKNLDYYYMLVQDIKTGEHLAVGFKVKQDNKYVFDNLYKANWVENTGKFILSENKFNSIICYLKNGQVTIMDVKPQENTIFNIIIQDNTGKIKTEGELLYVPYLLKEAKKDGLTVLEKATNELVEVKSVYDKNNNENEYWHKATHHGDNFVKLSINTNELGEDIETFYVLLQDVVTEEYIAVGFTKISGKWELNGSSLYKANWADGIGNFTLNSIEELKRTSCDIGSNNTLYIREKKQTENIIFNIEIRDSEEKLKTTGELLYVPYLLKEAKKDGLTVLEKATDELVEVKSVYDKNNDENEYWHKATHGDLVSLSINPNSVGEDIKTFYVLLQDVVTEEYIAVGFSEISGEWKVNNNFLYKANWADGIGNFTLSSVNDFKRTKCYLANKLCIIEKKQVEELEYTIEGSTEDGTIILPELECKGGTIQNTTVDGKITIKPYTGSKTVILKDKQSGNILVRWEYDEIVKKWEIVG